MGLEEQDEKLSLTNLMGGVAVAKFDHEIERVLENIVDMNTPATAKREISLKVTIKPDKDRDLGVIDVAVSSKLAAPEKVGTKLFISKTRTGLVATEHNPRQPGLFGRESEMEKTISAGNVATFRQKGEGQ